jgi:hypothetical protein
MRRVRWWQLLLVASAFLQTASNARSEMIQWGYASFAVPGTVRPDHPFPGPIPFLLPLPFPQAGVHFHTGAGDASGSSHIVLANLTASSFAPAERPDRYDHQPFQLMVGILDVESNRAKVAVFTGQINGSVSLGSAGLQIRFEDPIKTLHIGSHVFRINIDSVSPPGAPGGSPGAISADVKVWHNPEPSSLVLAGIGVVAWGVRRRRTGPAAM